MAGVGFSVPANPGLDVGRIQPVFDAQVSFASNSINAEKYKARVEAIGQIVSAYIGKLAHPPSLDDVVSAIEKVGAGLNRLS